MIGFYGTPFWTNIRSHGAILSPVDVPRSSTYVPRSSTYVPRSSIYVPRSSIYVPRSSIYVPRSPIATLDPFSSNPPRSSISDRRYSTLDRTLHVPRSPFLCPRSNISTPCSSNWFSLRISTRATTPRSYTPEKPRSAPPLLNHRPSVRDSFALLRMRSLNDTRGRALMAAERRRGYRSSSSRGFKC